MYDFSLPSEFERMYEDYFSKIYQHVFYRVLHKQDCEDLVSEIFLKVARNIFRFNPQEASFNTWIFAIARNTLIDHFRRRSNVVSLEHCDGLIWVDFEEQYASIVGEDRRMLYQALRQLDHRTRQILSLKYFAELNNREISRLINVNESTVSTLFLRGKKKMRELIDEKIS